MKKREVYISLMRVICAFAVVMIHCNTCFSEFNIKECWGLGNFIHGSLAFAVPVFLMISGATLMNYQKRYSTRDFFKKRFFKTVVPYVVWSLIGDILSLILGITPVHLVYVFFLYLFGIYLSMPLFSFIKEEYQDKIITFVVIVSFLLNYLVPFIYDVFPRKFEIMIPFDIANGYLIYALLGYLLAKYDLSFFCRMGLYVLALIGFVIRIGGTYVYSIESGSIDVTFREYTNLTCLLSAVGVFVLIKQIGQMIKNDNIIRFIEWLSQYTFSIFLIHYYIVKVLKKYFLIEYIHTLGYKVILPVIVMVISVGIIWILRKIPFVHKILP